MVNMSVRVTPPPRSHKGTLQKDSTQSGRQNRKLRAPKARAGKFDVFGFQIFLKIFYNEIGVPHILKKYLITKSGFCIF